MKRLLLTLMMLTALVGRAADDLSLLGQIDTNHIARQPGPDDRNIARLVSALLEKSHYLQEKRPGDAELSGRFLDRYLDSLDPQHMIFLQSDVEEFDKYRPTLWNLTRRLGDTMPGEIVFARFLDRYAQQLIFATNMLSSGELGFEADERYVYNRKELPRPKNLEEARDLWRLRLRYEYLEEKLGKKKHDEIVKTILRRYARQWRVVSGFDPDDVLQIYLSALAHVFDPHSEYMGKPSYENFNINMKLALFGIGAVLQSDDGYCKIVSLTPGGPAEKSKKIKPNDRIVAVAQATNEWVDVVDMKLNKVVEMIRGEQGTVVRLSIIPADSTDTTERKVVTIVRDEIKLEDSEAKAKIFDLPAENGRAAARIGVIDLPSFYADLGNRAADHKSTTTDVTKLLNKLKEQNVAGIVLDLRRNGGGSLEEAIKLSGLFIKEGPIVQVKDPVGPPMVDRDDDSSVAYEGPLVVMTSRFSASASEIFAGAMQDYGRAVIVGDATTHGKGTVQTVQELNRILRTDEKLGALKFTIRKFYRASGASTQLRGVTPDIVLPSVNNHVEVGESSLPGALAWDEVSAAKYEPVNLVQPHLPELLRRSAQRTETNKDFAWVRQEIERYKKKKDDKTVSLNEAKRLAEKKESEERAEARKKELKSRPEPEYKVYELTLKLCDEPGLPPPVAKTNDTASVSVEKPGAGEPADQDPAEEAAEEYPTPSVDITLEETRRVLLDLIELSAKKSAIAAKP